MSMPLVSVIVPVYNVAAYLPDCLDSILNQSYTNLEILLIDDGSTDESGEICDSYAQRDSRITVIHKENGGPSDARNAGLKTAVGKYVAFFDSDDTVESGYIEKMLRAIQRDGAQVAVCGWKEIYSTHTGVTTEQLPGCFDGIVSYKEQIFKILNTELFGSLCNKMYSFALIKKEGIFFEKLKNSEDVLFNCRYFSLKPKIAIVNEALYCYYHRNVESLSKKYIPGVLDLLRTVHRRRTEFQMQLGMNSPEHLSFLASTYCNYAFASISITFKAGTPETFSSRYFIMREIINDAEIKEHFRYLRPRDNRQRLFYLLYRIKSPIIMCFCYSFLFFVRDVYLWIRNCRFKKRANKG